MYSYSKEYQNSIRTCAELTKFDSYMCRTYKKQFGHMTNSDMCSSPKIMFIHISMVQNPQAQGFFKADLGVNFAPRFL